MAKQTWNNPIDKTVDWGGDPSTGYAPVSGEMVQRFIKESFEKKAGEFYPDSANNRYIVFADSEARNAYLADPTRTDLILGTFDAPSNYTARIDLVSSAYNAVFLNSTGNYIEFTFDIKNKQDMSTGENVNVTYTFIRNSIKQVVSERKMTGDTVRLNIDKYLGEGTNTIIIGISGQTTLAATTVSVTYDVVNLSLSDKMDISKVYDLSKGSKVLEVPFKVSGYGTKTVEWYIDGVALPSVKAEDEVVDTSAERTKRITISNLSQGRHSLQFRARTKVNGELFYTDTLYRDFLIYTDSGKSTIMGVALTIPKANGLIGANDSVVLYDMVQYVPYDLRFATYSPTNALSTQVQVYLEGALKSTVGSANGLENVVTLVPTSEGASTLLLKASDASYSIPVHIKGTPTSLEEITNGLVLDFNANGKTNGPSGNDRWSYGNYIGTFRGFNWNNTSGWVNGRLEMNPGSSFGINYAPLASSPTSTGKTIEIEWSTKSVSNDNAVICDLRGSNGAGLLITATKVTLTSAAGVVIETEYKSDENVRVAFVINQTSGVTNQKLSFIYANGILSRCNKWAADDNYDSAKQILFRATDEASVSLKAIRIYDVALSSDDILNNYTLYRDTVDEMLEVYDRNNVYIDGTSTFSPEKMNSRLPVMIVTGNIPVLENSSDTGTQIVVDIEYTNLQDPSKSFRMEGAAMRPQGTSSMGYPKKNFRIYTQEVEGTVLYDAEGKVVEDKLYSFKKGAQPVNCWCLKADYAESSGTHNTGIARLWNNALKNAQIEGEYVCRTGAQKAALAAKYEFDVRTTIDGFPILLFYRPTKNDDVIFIGKYNFNNDKSTESVFGFTGIPGFENDSMQCWEVLNNDNALALFTTTDNFDTDWSKAFESRYPDTKTPYTGDLKAFCKWMSTVTQSAFASEKWQHLNVYMMAAYWCYLMRHAAADQFVKNAMFTSEDGKHFYYILYDNDTINGLINTGHLEIDPLAGRQTMNKLGEYVFAGHDSRLWNMLEADTEFMQIVSEVDNALYSAGISYEETIRIFDEEQADKWVERVYNQDSQYKYIGPYNEKGINNLFMLQGKRDLHRRWWLAKRFSVYDAKYVSGTYKSKAIEVKLLNNSSAGLRFTVTAGYPLDYGYGINNLPREFGVYLTQGASKEFVTKEAVSRGDPIRIYGAPNIAGLNFSKMAQEIATLNIANAFDDALGTKLTSLIVGGSSDNNALAEISGLKQAVALEYLDIQNMMQLISLDLSSQPNFKTLKAMGSGITSVVFAKGAPVERLELPASMIALSLDELPYLKSDDIVLEDISRLSSITIKGCPSVSNDFDFVHDWIESKTTADRYCSLVMEGVDWHLSNADGFMQILDLKTNGGTFSIKGKVRMDSIKVEQIYAIRDILGESSFDPNAEFYVDIPSVLQINAEDSVLEGNNLQFTTSLYPYLDGTYTWSLENGRTGCSIDQNGLLITEETALDTSNVVVKVRFVSTDGEVLTATKTISVVRRTYPQDIIINGATDPRESAEYTWSHDTEGVNGEYSVVWSLEGNMTSYWRIKSSDSQRCVLEKTGAMPSSVSGTIKVTIVRDFDKSMASTSSLVLSLPVVFPADATIIGNTNPLEKPYTYTWETTTEGVNGEFYAKWSLSGDITSVVKIMSQDNEKCVMELIEAPTEITTGTLTLSHYKVADKSPILTATKDLEAIMEGVIITSKTNPIIQKALYNNGIAANPNYTLQKEAELANATSLKSAMRGISSNDMANVTQFNELQYFTGLTEILSSTFYQFGALTSVIIPNNVKVIGEDAFCDSKLVNITIPDSVTTIKKQAFASCPTTRVVIGKGVTSVEQNAFLACTGELFFDFNPQDINEALNGVFYGSSFTKVTAGSNVTRIGKQAFLGCDKIQEVILSDSVIELGVFSFSGCSAITKITLSNTLETIEQSAFASCRSLVNITIPDSVTSIGHYAFSNCIKLKNVTIGQSVQTIGLNAFDKCCAIENIYCIPSIAPTVYVSSFGATTEGYAGRNNYDKGTNRLHIPQNATNYEIGAWLDPLQNADKCGFSIYGKLVINAAKESYYTITYITVENIQKTIRVVNGTWYLSDVQYDTEMTIRVVEGGEPDEGLVKTFIYNTNNQVHNYTFSLEASWITIDQTASDPSTMISGDINGATIQQIRNKSHRYLGKYTATGVMTICQLDDDTSYKYWDGSEAKCSGEEGDVFVKLPRFWYACIEESTDVWNIGFYIGNQAPPESYWKEWDENSLLGAFNGYISSNKMYSRATGSGVTISSSSKTSLSNANTAASNRGEGFCSFPFKWYNILSLLFYAQYGTTNFASVFDTYAYTTYSYSEGATSGMKDSYTKDNNFWGVGGFIYFNYNNYIGNVLVDFVTTTEPRTHKWKITEDDGSVREVISPMTSGYILKMVLGANADMIPAQGDGTATQGYCTSFTRTATSNRTMQVSLGKQILINVPNNNSASIGRLAFRGAIIEETDPAVFKSLTAIG